MEKLFAALAEVFDGDLPIEGHAREALRASVAEAAALEVSADASPLPEDFLRVMQQASAHPVCKLIAAAPLQWTPPQTSDDPLYVKHSLSKVHVELLGPKGLVRSDAVRLGLYGMSPHAEYGVRTHPAEEIYIMLAGKVEWKRADDQYLPHNPGERSHHPSMMKHANRTTNSAFMSVYVWHGDLSTDGYVYAGIADT